MKFNSLKWKIHKGHLIAIAFFGVSVSFAPFLGQREEQLKAADLLLTQQFANLSITDFMDEALVKQKQHDNTWFALIESNGNVTVQSKNIPPQLKTQLSQLKKTGYFWEKDQRIRVSSFPKNNHQLIVGMDKEYVYEPPGIHFLKSALMVYSLGAIGALFGIWYTRKNA